MRRYLLIAIAAAGIAAVVATFAYLALRSDGSPPVALTWAQLRNATYPSEFPRAKAAPLLDGVYEEEIVPGAATRLKIQLADIAGFGQIDDDGSIDAAVVLIGSPGGSGTFIHLVAVLNDGGSANPAATVLLGDRVAVRAIQVEGSNIVVRMRVRGSSDPFAVLTTEVTRVYSLRDRQLNLESEQTAEVPSVPPDQFAFQAQELAIEPGKSVTERGILKPGELATYLVRGDSGQELRVTAASQFNNAILSIQGVDDLTQLVSRTNYVNNWSGALPSSQAYAMTVVSLAGNDLRYELKVELKPAPTAVPTATVRPAPIATRSPGGSAAPVPAPLKGAFRPAELQLSMAFASASRFMEARAPTWGVAVASPATATLHAQNGDDQFELASTIKVLIALAILDVAQRENRFVDSFELALLWPMITFSDNDSATRLWDQLGGGRGLANYIAGIGETGVKPYDGPFWGTSTASPASLARIVARATFGDLLNAHHRTLFLGLLEKVIPSQRWGISAGLEGDGGAAALVGIKDGWFPAEAGWRVNSIGFIVAADGPYYSIAVLTNLQPSLQYGIATIEGVAERVNSTLLQGMQPPLRP